MKAELHERCTARQSSASSEAASPDVEPKSKRALLQSLHDDSSDEEEEIDTPTEEIPHSSPRSSVSTSRRSTPCNGGKRTRSATRLWRRRHGVCFPCLAHQRALKECSPQPAEWLPP